ncbi:A24 family peptidase [Streptomyces sp. NBC_01744]|nr:MULTISPECIES: A24 family peptidase [unclassified Streptomyces]WSC47083.1 A24 family peptidase [Streptomyces sp. NBC_01762]WSD26737.1 A24 family peptidase [Streptomyces sp. NBC_01751]WSF84769.1 A24 family peptidase [Streptomyces sp. NBC_01744]WSJ51337.1 A24 family peptidase [Streptomyces sp. NBC_01318]
MYVMLTGVAALWGAATGLLVPRAAYRFSVEPEDAWRDTCPAGHPFSGVARGWLGSTRCAACAAGAAARTTAQTKTAAVPAPPDERDGAAEPAEIAESADASTKEGDGREGDPRTEPVARYAPAVLAPVAGTLGCAALAAATGLRPELAVWLLLAPVAVLLATIDRRVHRLPDRLTLPLAGAAVVLLGGAALLPEHAGSWLSALLGGLALGGFYFLLFLINPNGMGFGDVKLALSLGVALGWYGWAVVFAGGFAGFVLGAVYGFGLVILRRAGRKTGIPFGPFMIAGALLGILFGGLAA